MNPVFLFCEKMTPLRKLLLMKAVAGGAPIAEYTATGNPLTFNTNVSKPLKSLLIPWTPSQSGSGDPSPTNVRPISGVSAVNVTRCGVNLFDKNEVTHGKYIAEDGSINDPLYGYDWCITDYMPVIGNGKITYNGLTQLGLAPYSAFYDVNKVFISSFKQKTGKDTVSIPQNAKYVRFSILNTGNELNNFITVLGETIGDYESYIGTTVSVVFPALGKNLYDLWANGYWNSSTKAWSNSISGAVSKPIKVKTGDVVTLSQDNESASYQFIEWSKSVAQPTDYTSSDCLAFVRSSDGAPKTYTVQHDCYLCVFANIGSDTFASRHVMLNTGETALPYEPYTNTVYGGSLDLVSGVLTVTQHSNIRSIYYSSHDANKGYVQLGMLVDNAYQQGTKTMSDRFSPTVPSGTVGRMSWYNGILYCNAPDEQFESFDDAGAQKWYETYQPQFVFEAVTPYTIQLTPTEITALLGDNTIWSDTNGSNTAVYYKRG